MAIDIKSQEFANAWRMVSEALLQLVQSGGLIPVAGSPGTGTTPALPPKENQPDPLEPTPPKKEERKKLDERYAACPIKQLDGSYILKNLKDERQMESTFKITRYSDGTCDIELCDLQGEARQVFKDTRSDRLPSAVGSIVGEITADSKIVNTKLGKGKIDGRSVRITEPLEVTFR